MLRVKTEKLLSIDCDFCDKSIYNNDMFSDENDFVVEASTPIQMRYEANKLGWVEKNGYNACKECA